MKLVLFPIKVTTRSLRWVGFRRLVLIGLGATLALMLTPVTGSEMRRRVSRLVARRVPDADLAARVRHELSHSPRTWHLPQPSISVLQGRVVLAGQAPHATGRADLERVVAGVPGVVFVENEIIVA
jgi:osmotically-inducible protein OsmY